MRDLGAGFTYLLKGQRWVARHGKQYGFGLLPGLITLVLYAAALVALALWGEDFVAWATPFADDWSSPWRGPLPRLPHRRPVRPRPCSSSVLTFTAVTLLDRPALLRDPLREGRPGRLPGRHRPRVRPAALARAVDLGPGQPPHPGARRAVGRPALRAAASSRSSGQTAVPVIGFFVTGFFLTEELTAVALQRRGVELRDPPRPAALPQDPRLGLRHPARPGLPGPLRRGVPDAGRGRGRHPDGPGPAGRGPPTPSPPAFEDEAL